MEFAGKKVYLRRNSLEEIPEEENPEEPPKLARKLSVVSFSDDELNRSLCDDEEIIERNRDMSPPDSPRAVRVRSGSISGSEGSEEAVEEAKQRPLACVVDKDPGKKKYRQRVDTNVVCVKLSTLQNRGCIATGDAIFCSNCGSALNYRSELTAQASDASKQTWVCEFCELPTEVTVEAEEFPQEDTMDYMIMSQPVVAAEQRDATDVAVIFCIDISGSMVVSQAVSGQLQLRGIRNIASELQGFSDFNLAEQYMLGGRDTTYVSRLQCVQAAIDSQLTDTANKYPDRKLGLVAFNSDVTIVGDGMSEPHILTGDRLLNVSACIETGSSLASKISHPISQTKSRLSDKVWSLSENGATALGPALLASIALASHGKAGSKVIICTDGIANVGVGSINDPKDPVELTKAREFFSMAGQVAKEKGVSVSVITIEGEECSVERLAEVAEFTGGDVLRVNPLEITNEFANILSKPVIATHVSAVVKLHRGLMFRNEGEGLVDPSTLKKELGNVNEDTEFTFEYSVRPSEELQALGVDPTSKQILPFQTQIHFTTPDGMQCMRVITAFQGATAVKEEAEQDINFKVLGVNAAQQSAKAVKEGDYRKAQVVMRGWKNMMNSRAQTEEEKQSVDNYLQGIRHFNREVQSAQVEEREQGIAMEEMDQAVQKEARWAKRGDKLSYMNYNAKRANSKQCSLM